MIISHRHRYIFLKTGKTAGTSIEIALSKFCGPEDVITPIAKQDEQQRAALGYRGAQNHFIGLSQYSMQDWGRFLATGKRARFYNHISAKEVIARVGSRIWSEYYKFCFERNPWDRVISHYYWRYQQEPRPPIGALIDSPDLDVLTTRGFDIYTVDGKTAVDRVCLYENLDKELEEVAERLGLPERLVLPRAKGGARKDRRHYSDMLSRSDEQKISKRFAREITLFGYRF